MASSFVIVNWNSPEDGFPCVRGIDSQTTNLAFESLEAIVVDNASAEICVASFKGRAIPYSD